MEQLIERLQSDFRQLDIVKGTSFCWVPEKQQVLYDIHSTGVTAKWSLLHESGHALLVHTTYKSDFELLRLEVAAWVKAKELASLYSLQIDEDHIQNCLDTYRDWLYRRSICPTCETKSLQRDNSSEYECYNCHTNWKVSNSRFCRPYRLRQKTKKSPAL